MKKILIAVFFLGVAGSTLGQKTKKPKTPPPATNMCRNLADSASYALGQSIAQNLQAQGFKNLNIDLLQTAIGDVFGKKPSVLGGEQNGNVINKYVQIMKSEALIANKKAGAAFMAANKTKPGVKTLASGLQYMVLTEGTGEIPKLSDRVKCHYHGTLIDGTIFDSSVDRGQPAVFPVNGVISGWTEVLQLMPVGSKWKVFIPAELAYGDNQAGQVIKPGSTLIFDIELISIER